MTKNRHLTGKCLPILDARADKAYNIQYRIPRVLLEAIYVFGHNLKHIEKLAEKQDGEKLAKLAEDKHMETRLAALDALGRCRGNEDAYNALITAVHDEEAQVRLHAVSALAEMGDVKARAHLDHQRTKEADAAVKTAIEDALKHLHGREE